MLLIRNHETIIYFRKKMWISAKISLDNLNELFYAYMWIDNNLFFLFILLSFSLLNCCDWTYPVFFGYLFSSWMSICCSYCPCASASVHVTSESCIRVFFEFPSFDPWVECVTHHPPEWSSSKFRPFFVTLLNFKLIAFSFLNNGSLIRIST